MDGIEQLMPEKKKPKEKEHSPFISVNGAYVKDAPVGINIFIGSETATK